MSISVIDIFAGPGGLGEGFCSFSDESGARIFNIALSIEKESYAHQTLTLRSFFRQFASGQVPEEYYAFVRGEISLDILYNAFPVQAAAAKEEAWLAELGTSKTSVPTVEVDRKIRSALKGQKNWLLVGGPPCQAFSIVGRSRRKERVLDGAKDHRVELYKQYLRILAVHKPAVFVMENVKGLLSAETSESPVFTKILEDLSDPATAYRAEFMENKAELDCSGYKIFSLVVPPKGFDDNGMPVFRQKDFIIQSEKFGVPQTRHRVIILGIRGDLDRKPGVLRQMEQVPISKVISGLPKLRSALSKTADSKDAWLTAIKNMLKKHMLTGVEKPIKEEIHRQIELMSSPAHASGASYIRFPRVGVGYRKDWYLDEKLEGVCNHQARGHMESDLLRYFYASCFGKVKGFSPKLEDFPRALLPKHGNIQEGIAESKFADRFRVQPAHIPSKTITSHISKDGHYYIHPDPAQCRSFTVREAARIQTFPDNYYFCGPRTSQFTQVGNAVPPLLANNIAKVVNDIFRSLNEGKTGNKKNSQR